MGIKTAITAALMFFCLTSGCAALPMNHEPNIHYHADVRFTPPERECIKASANTWYNQTSGVAKVEVSYDYDPTDPASVLSTRFVDRMVKWRAGSEEVKEIERGHVGEWYLLGQASGKVTNDFRTPMELHLVTERFVTNGVFDSDMCQGIAIHEMGHNLGMSHMDRKTNIMYPSWQPGRSACLKKDDLFQFGMIHSVPMDVLKPCEDDLRFVVEELLETEEGETPDGAYEWMRVRHD